MEWIAGVLDDDDLMDSRFDDGTWEWKDEVWKDSWKGRRRGNMTARVCMEKQEDNAQSTTPFTHSVCDGLTGTDDFCFKYTTCLNVISRHQKNEKKNNLISSNCLG